jgi:ubiquitin carboxyl-terminal hydrolase 34
MVVNTLPNMLFLHLSRIQMDMETFMNKKLNDRIEFPNTLNMRPYMKNEVLKQEKEAIEKAKKNQRKKKREEEAKAKKTEDAKEEEDQQMDDNVESEGEPKGEDVEMDLPLQDEDLDYKLVGVVLHMGTADAGHYLSYININRGEKDEETPEWMLTEKEKWLEFNDSQVKHYAFNSLEADCYGGGNPNSMGGESFDYSKNAYMLIYEKRRKNPLKFVVPEELVQRNEAQMLITTDSTELEQKQ